MKSIKQTMTQKMTNDKNGGNRNLLSQDPILFKDWFLSTKYYPLFKKNPIQHTGALTHSGTRGATMNSTIQADCNLLRLGTYEAWSSWVVLAEAREPKVCFLMSKMQLQSLCWFECLLVIEMDGNCVRLCVCVIPVNFSHWHIQTHPPIWAALPRFKE